MNDWHIIIILWNKIKKPFLNEKWSWLSFFFCFVFVLFESEIINFFSCFSFCLHHHRNEHIIRWMARFIWWCLSYFGFSFFVSLHTKWKFFLTLTELAFFIYSKKSNGRFLLLLLSCLIFFFFLKNFLIISNGSLNLLAHLIYYILGLALIFFWIKIDYFFLFCLFLFVLCVLVDLNFSSENKNLKR